MEMCQYVSCVCRDFLKNFMTLLLSLPSPGNPRASAALEVGNAQVMQSIVLGNLSVSPSLPALAAFLPSSSSCLPGTQQLRIRSGELSGTDPSSESADKRPVLQTQAGIVTSWFSQQ